MNYKIINILVIIGGIVIVYFISFILLKKCDNKPPVEEIRYIDSLQSRNDTIKAQIEILKQHRDNEIITISGLDNDSTIKLFKKLVREQ